MAINLVLWAIAFYLLLGFTPLLLCYIIVINIVILLSALQYGANHRLAAQLFVVISCISLYIIDDGLTGTPVTGIEFLYVANILYIVAFYMEQLYVEYYISLVSTAAVFALVNYTPWTAHLASSVPTNVPVSIRLLVFTLTSGVIVYRFVVFLRSTMQSFLSSKIQQSETEILFNNIEESICMMDKNLRIIRFNKSYERLFEFHYRIKPAIGIPFPSSLDFPDRDDVVSYQLIQRVLAGEALIEEYTTNPEGKLVIYEVSFFPIMSSNTKAPEVDKIGIICRDITTRRRLEMDIVYSQVGLLEMIAHDLKAPIGMIKSVNSLSPEDPDGHKDFISKTSAQAISSINNILAFSRYLSNSSTPGFLNHDLYQVLQEKVDELAPHAQMHGQQLILHMPQNNMHVKMNKEAFGRAISNLINNAIKFSPQAGQICIDVERHPTEKDTAVIKVSDEGIGIPEHMRDHLFEKFTTAGKKGSHGEESFGLGLYISSIITKLHGGKLELDKTRRQGATFIITLPLVRYATAT